MANLTRAATADDVLLWLHGRRFGVVGDGQAGDPSALVLDGKVVASNRLAASHLIKAITAGSAAGALTLTGAAVGDTVVAVTDLSSPADVSASFEATVSVANQIQQLATASGHVVLVVVQPRS